MVSAKSQLTKTFQFFSTKSLIEQQEAVCSTVVVAGILLVTPDLIYRDEPALLTGVLRRMCCRCWRLSDRYTGSRRSSVLFAVFIPAKRTVVLRSVHGCEGYSCSFAVLKNFVCSGNLGREESAGPRSASDSCQPDFPRVWAGGNLPLVAGRFFPGLQSSVFWLGELFQPFAEKVPEFKACGPGGNSRVSFSSSASGRKLFPLEPRPKANNRRRISFAV